MRGSAAATSSAAETLPRLSPPAACPASSTTSRRSARSRVAVRRNALAIAPITCGPASMFPPDAVVRSLLVTAPRDALPPRVHEPAPDVEPVHLAALTLG